MSDETTVDPVEQPETTEEVDVAPAEEVVDPVDEPCCECPTPLIQPVREYSTVELKEGVVLQDKNGKEVVLVETCKAWVQT